MASELEDLDLPTVNSERLRGVDVLGVSLSSLGAMLESEAGEEFPSPSTSSAPSLVWLLGLAVLSATFLESMALLPRSAERRVSFCLRALLKKESPLSSDLLARRRSLEEMLGERRLVKDELLLELLTGFRSGRPPSAPFSGTRGLSVRGLA